MVEALKGNSFKTKIYPLLPETTTRVQVKFIQVHRDDLDTHRYSIMLLFTIWFFNSGSHFF